MVGALDILPLTHQSGDLSFLDWASLFTLCLTPLAVHLLAGAPPASCLVQENRPRWHDCLCHYNPTSIMWRYAAIVNRRVRARDWSPTDMAAANALFWTDRGWDGSEKMAELSLPHCRRAPARSRVEFLSVETVKTVVVALQGCQSILCVFAYVKNTTLETVFFPLAIFGLARLFPALWLTGEFEFAPLPDIPAGAGHRKSSFDSLIDLVVEDGRQDGRFLPTSFWASRVARMFFCVLLLLLVVKSGFNITPQTASFASTTTFFVGLFYISLLGVSFLILTYYFVRTGAESTIIPCISSIWYKIYTSVVMALMVVMVALASIETRKTPCGMYTTFPGYLGDSVCLLDQPAIVPVEPSGIKNMIYGFGQFGLATNVTLGTPQSNLRLKEGEFLVDEFIGSCLGQFTGNTRLHASTLETIVLT